LKSIEEIGFWVVSRWVELETVLDGIQRRQLDAKSQFVVFPVARVILSSLAHAPKSKFQSALPGSSSRRHDDLNGGTGRSITVELPRRSLLPLEIVQPQQRAGAYRGRSGAKPQISRMIYFTGDTHFGDPRVLHLDRRPFSSMVEHDRPLIRTKSSFLATTSGI
jgi:hypothetical protein